MKLSPITKPPAHPKFAVIDIETMNWTKFIVLGFYDGKRYLEFRTLKAFLKFLESDPDVPKNIVSHFGGKFDNLFILKELLKNEKYKIKSLIPRGSSILSIECDIAGRTFVFRDSSALLPFSLKSICENFGVQAQKMEWDHSKTKGYTKKLSTYLQFDCKGLYQSLEKFFAWPLISKAGGAWTMASQAMRVYRTFLKDDIYGLGKMETDFCRQAYLGGRTEIFRPLTKKPLYEYDVNSLYPFVMKENFFPQGKSFFTFEYNPKKLGIYSCHVVAPKTLDIPVLGVVRQGKYIFPVGSFNGHFTTAEIEYAKTFGYKFVIHEGIEFQKQTKLFSEFIDSLYAIRLTSPKGSVSEIIAKLLMNSSYGRWGMNIEKENIGFELKEDSEEYELIKVGKRKIQLFKEPVELKSFTHVAVAAFVTSYARIRLHRLLTKAGDSLYYCDTDSVWTTKEFPSGKNLGDLKLEDLHKEGACFLLPKTYIAMGGKKQKKLAMKGFSSRKTEHFTMEDFQNGLQGEMQKFKVTNEPKFATLKTALKQKKIVAMTKGSDKSLKSLYDKRIIIKNGLGEPTTKPIILQE